MILSGSGTLATYLDTSYIGNGPDYRFLYSWSYVPSTDIMTLILTQQAYTTNSSGYKCGCTIYDTSLDYWCWIKPSVGTIYNPEYSVPDKLATARDHTHNSSGWMTNGTWTEYISGTGGDVTITLQYNMQATWRGYSVAGYTQGSQSFTINADTGLNCTAGAGTYISSVTCTSPVDYGNEGCFTAVAQSGYQLEGWYGPSDGNGGYKVISTGDHIFSSTTGYTAYIKATYTVYAQYGRYWLNVNYTGALGYGTSATVKIAGTVSDTGYDYINVFYNGTLVDRHVFSYWNGVISSYFSYTPGTTANVYAQCYVNGTDTPANFTYEITSLGNGVVNTWVGELTWQQNGISTSNIPQTTYEQQTSSGTITLSGCWDLFNTLVSSSNPYKPVITTDYYALYAKGKSAIVYYTTAAVCSTGVTEAAASPTSVASGSNCVFTATVADGYTFNGWYTDAAFTSVESSANPYTKAITSNTTLYAKAVIPGSHGGQAWIYVAGVGWCKGKIYQHNGSTWNAGRSYVHDGTEWKP